MPIVTFSPAGQFGVISDLRPHELPPTAWSAAQNIHFLEGYAEKIRGYRSLYGGASVPPYFLTSLRPITGNAFWIYAGDSSVYCYDTSHHNITRVSGAYDVLGKLNWQGGVMNGLLFLNNGIDKPQVWSPAVNTTKLVDLPNWPANTTAAIVRTFKNFMIALDVTKSSSRDARLIKWSHPAEPNTYPDSWDETDPTKDAGEYPFSETEGILVDCAPMRDINVVYKDDSVWGMSYVGGNSIFRFFNIFRNIGILSKDCVVEFQTGQHLVFGRDDIFVHDGQTPISILREKSRRAVYDNLDMDNAQRSFVAMDAANTEIWLCYPETGNTYCNKALIWNWKRNTLGFKELPNVVSIGLGIADESAGADSWSAAIGTWDSDASTWGQTVANPAQTRLVAASPDSSKLYGFIPDTTDADGVPFTAFLRRTGIGIPFKENTAPDLSSVKFCSNVIPQITGTIGGVVQVRLGGQMYLDEEPAWSDWQNYVIGSTRELNFTVPARMFAIEFKSTTSIFWKLQGYSLDVQKIGDY